MKKKAIFARLLICYWISAEYLLVKIAIPLGSKDYVKGFLATLREDPKN